MSPLTNSDTNAYNQETLEITTAGSISSPPPVDNLEFTAYLPADEIHRRALQIWKLQGKKNRDHSPCLAEKGAAP